MTDDLNVEWVSVPTCPLCENEEHEVFYVEIPAKRPITHWRICPECGHVFCSPRPSDTWLHDWYTCGYREMTYGNEDPEKLSIASVEDEIQRAIRLCNMLLRTAPKVTRALDIGSSTGALLAGIFDKFEPQMAYGVEPNDCYRAFAEARAAEAPDLPGHLNLVSTLDQVPKSPKFDLVTAVEVLEHVPDPLGMLTLLREKYMRQDGYILVATPILFGGHISPMWFPHVHVFHHDTLLLMLRKAGFYPFLFETYDASQYPFCAAPIQMIAMATVKDHGYNTSHMLDKFNMCREHTQALKRELEDAKARQGYRAG